MLPPKLYTGAYVSSPALNTLAPPKPVTSPARMNLRGAPPKSTNGKSEISRSCLKGYCGGSLVVQALPVKVLDYCFSENVNSFDQSTLPVGPSAQFVNRPKSRNICRAYKTSAFSSLQNCKQCLSCFCFGEIFGEPIGALV